MKTIRWKKEEYINLGYGSFTGVIHTETTMDGLVMKAFIFKGLRDDEAEQIISVLSPNYDITHLYSLVFEALSNKEHCEKIWKIHNMRMKNPEEKHI